MGKPNWMKFDPDKIALDVDGMSLEQEGAYMRCVRHIWRNGPLPEARLSKVCGNAWEAVKACAAEYDGGLSFAWLEDARSEAHGRSKRASVAGVASFNARSTDVQHKSNGRSTDVLSISKSSSTSQSEGQERKVSTENRKTLFCNSRFMVVEVVAEELPELVAEGVNLTHYRDAIRNWSDTKDEKRSDRGWLATFRQWTKTDRDKGELKKAKAVSTGGWNPRA